MKLDDKVLRATPGFVIVEGIDHDEQTTPSGIILLTKNDPKALVSGYIHSAGKFIDYERGKKSYDPIVKSGDKIMYKKYEAEKISFDDKILYRLPYERVRMVVDEQ